LLQLRVGDAARGEVVFGEHAEVLPGEFRLFHPQIPLGALQAHHPGGMIMDAASQLARFPLQELRLIPKPAIIDHPIDHVDGGDGPALPITHARQGHVELRRQARLGVTKLAPGLPE
jgi:hypothetical protein